MPSLSRTILFALVALLAQQPQTPVRDAASMPPSSGTGVIAGTVVSDDGKPIRRVTVTLSAASAGMMMNLQRNTTTDDRGRFVFTRLPAGNFSAPRASKSGFVSVTYGEKRLGGIGTPITLTEGQRVTIALKMIRGAVITGTLFDQSGRPAPQTSVRATAVRIVDGVRQEGPYVGGTGGGTSDDRGVYRIYGLAPGDYVVGASPRLAMNGETRPITDAELQWAQRQLQPQTTVGAGAPAASLPPKPAQAIAYTSVYFPGTADVATASIVTLVAGQERAGVDFPIQFVPTARVEGTLVDENGQPPQTAQMNLVSKLTSSMSIDSMLMLDMLMLTRPPVVNGKFSLTGVKPGEYTLMARAAPRGAGPAAGAGAGGRGAAPPMTLWASMDITVNGDDISGIAMRLQPGMSLSGRVVFNATTLTPPEDLSRVSVRLNAAPNPSGVTVTVNGAATPVAADGTFSITGITPGRYLVYASAPGISASGSSPSWLLKSAIIGGVDAADVPFEIRPDQDVSNVVLAFTDRTAELSGTVLDTAGHPTPEFSVFLFPTDKTIWSMGPRSRRFRQPARASTSGTFKIAGLLPGEYYLAALTDYDPADLNKPAFLEQVSAAAMKITIAEGEKKVQDVKIAGGS